MTFFSPLNPLARLAVNGNPTAGVDRLPDGGTALLFRMHAPGVGELYAMGPRTRVLRKPGAPLIASIKALFAPAGGSLIFDVPLTELADKAVPLAALWGRDADDLLDKLLEAVGDADRLAIMGEAVSKRLARSGKAGPPPMIAEALHRLAAGPVTIDRLSADLGVSARGFRRQFSSAVGLSPKHYGRIARLQRALALALPRTLAWSEVALASGYYDQSHMAGDFRRLAMASPERVIDRHRHAEP